MRSPNDNIIRFYAGPGIGIGYSDDLMVKTGVFIGLKAMIGGECSFSRRLALSLSISPMLGGHFRQNDGMISMRLYRDGLIYGVMPKAGIRYLF